MRIPDEINFTLIPVDSADFGEIYALLSEILSNPQEYNVETCPYIRGCFIVEGKNIISPYERDVTLKKMTELLRKMNKLTEREYLFSMNTWGSLSVPDPDFLSPYSGVTDIFRCKIKGEGKSNLKR